MLGDTRKRYPAELKIRAVRIVAESRHGNETEWAGMTPRGGGCSGLGHRETVRKGLHQAHVDAGAGPGTSTEGSGELRRLGRQNAELEGRKAIGTAGDCSIGS